MLFTLFFTFEHHAHGRCIQTSLSGVCSLHKHCSHKIKRTNDLNQDLISLTENTLFQIRFGFVIDMRFFSSDTDESNADDSLQYMVHLLLSMIYLRSICFRDSSS